MIGHQSNWYVCVFVDGCINKNSSRIDAMYMIKY